MTNVDEAVHFYQVQEGAAGTHLALRWNGRVRFTVPRNATARETCWKIFRPGQLEFPLRVMARLPRFSRAANCVETESLASIRAALAEDAGLSCCRNGAPGVWSKDTLLFLHKDSMEPAYIVKAGAGEAVSALLQNEAEWLGALRDHAPLQDHIPEFVVHCSRPELSFVAERPLRGKLEFEFGEPHAAFLRKFQERSRCMMPFKECKLYRNLRSRMGDLQGRLDDVWSTRLEVGLGRIEQSFAETPILSVDAHNDFTPWNIRIENGLARVFDWEYADHEQLPLFDALHFALMPMALKGESQSRIAQKIRTVLQSSPQWFRPESCSKAETQVLAYMMSLCTLYLWSDLEASKAHLALATYAATIDSLCQ